MQQLAECDHDAANLFHHDCAGNEPGVHALVIGISRYQAPRRRGQRRRFEDLNGTATGAARFAEFLTEDFHHPDGIPVRTVRLLLDPIGNHLSFLPVGRRPWQEATLDHVGWAVDDWFEDCHRNPRNVALLYMAGHGVVTANEAQWGFLSAAGTTEESYRYGVNLTGIRERMRFRRARENIYIWDLCALRGEDVPRWNGEVGITGPDTGERTPGRLTEVTIAARLGTRNYALNAKDGTLMSRSLVGSDRGDAPRRLFHTAGELVSNHVFAVTPHRLGELLLPMMRSIRAAHLDGEEPVVRSDDRHRGISRPQPTPMFQIEVMPSDAAVILSVHHEDGSVERHEIAGASRRLELAAGTYQVDAMENTGSVIQNHHYRLPVERDMRIMATTGEPL